MLLQDRCAGPFADLARKLRSKLGFEGKLLQRPEAEKPLRPLGTHLATRHSELQRPEAEKPLRRNR